MKSKFIGIDFDGTVVTHKYPAIGEPLDYAIDTIEELIDAGHKIILTTMRSGERLEQAIQYLNENGINLYAVNNNPTQHHWTESPKIHVDCLIDNVSINCPLVDGNVDWVEVRELLVEKGYLDE